MPQTRFGPFDHISCSSIEIPTLFFLPISKAIVPYFLFDPVHTRGRSAFCNGMKYLSRGTLASLWAILLPDNFIKIHGMSGIPLYVIERPEIWRKRSIFDYKVQRRLG